MAELAALRAKLKDRQVKEGALGTAEASVCLDLTLLAELGDLEARRDRIVASQSFAGDPDSLAGSAPAEPDTAELDAEIEAKQAEVKAASLTLVFRAVSSSRYQEIVDEFDDPETERSAFMNRLCDESLLEVWSEEEKVGGPAVAGGLSWAEIHPETSFGEWDSITTLVFALNRRKIDAPFSSKPSKPTRH